MIGIKSKSFRQTLLAGVAACCLWNAVPDAIADDAKVSFQIAEQSLDAALNAYGVVADRQVLYTRGVVAGKTANAVIGEFGREEALAQLLKGSGLSFRVTSSNVVLVGDPRDSRLSDPSSDEPLRLAQADTASALDAATVTDEIGNKRDRFKRDEIIVTGTNIRGVNDIFSPVQSISRDDLDVSGFRSVSDYFDVLPQNFGSVGIDTQLANTSVGVGGASINLRGLGSEATLILLNGRRLGTIGLSGNFVDISAIPTSAIERIEVVTDGASAVYGSDAVAGVANIILRKDFQGAETRLGLGAINDGDGNQIKFGQTLGFGTDRTYGLLTYEFSSENELESLDRDFAATATQPTDLLPFTQKHAIFATGGFEISDSLRISSDAFFNDRRSEQFSSQDTVQFIQAFQETDVQQYGGAVGLEWDLSQEWTVSLNGSYTRSEMESPTTRLDRTDRDEVDEAESEIISVDANVGGSLFSISEEPVRGVVGVHYRREEYSAFSEIPAIDRVLVDRMNSRNVFAVFGEIYAPIVSGSNSLPGLERLVLSAAVRYEDYSDAGTSLDPKVGLSWSPISDLNIRGTFGTSFRAPTLRQQITDLFQANLGVFIDSQSPKGRSTSLLVFGTKGDLDPEQSTSWTVGFDYDPEWAPGFLLRGTYFAIDYSDRIATPTFGLTPMLEFTDFTAVPEQNPSQQRIQEVANSVPFLFDLSTVVPSLGDLQLADVTTILFATPQNTSKTKVKGIDFEVSYDWPTKVGDWRFFVGGTYMTTFEQQFSVLTPVDDILDTFGNPLDLRLRGGVQLRTDPVTASLFVNHAGGYEDDQAVGGPVPIDSWTTVDASVSLYLAELCDVSILEDASVNFSIRNLLNEDPPGIASQPLTGVLFDAANADPAGRRFGLLLTKRF